MLKHKLIGIIFPLFLLISILIPLINTQNVYAADATMMNEYKVWRSYTLISDCVRYGTGYRKDKIDFTDEQSTIDSIFISDGGQEAGNLYANEVSLDSSGFDCNTQSNIYKALNQLGFSDIYKFTNWLDSKSKGKDLSNDQIKSLLQDKVKELGARLDLASKPDFQYWFWNNVYRASLDDGGCGGVLSNDNKAGYNNVTDGAPFWYADPKTPGADAKSYSHANFKNDKDKGIEGLDKIMAAQLNKGAPSCIDVASQLTKVRANAYSQYLATNPNEVDAAKALGSNEGPKSGSCESNNGSMGWLLCGFIGSIDDLLVGKDNSGGLAGIVDELLNFDTEKFTKNGSGQIKEIWNSFKNIATLSLVVIALVMIIGQSVSKD